MGIKMELCGDPVDQSPRDKQQSLASHFLEQLCGCTVDCGCRISFLSVLQITFAYVQQVELLLPRVLNGWVRLLNEIRGEL